MYIIHNNKKQEKIKRVREDVPAIARVSGLSTNSRITDVTRRDSIFDTCVAMGLKTKVNKVNNIVAEVNNMQDAGSALQTIYKQFGVKGSFMVTWDGKGKLYWDPKSPVDSSVAIDYANANGLLPPPVNNPRKLLGF